MVYKGKIIIKINTIRFVRGGKVTKPVRSLKGVPFRLTK